MNVFQFVLAIVAIVIIGDVIKKWLTIREKRAANDPKQDARLAAMEERIQTLECLVTDKKSQLKAEIDALK